MLPMQMAPDAVNLSPLIDPLVEYAGWALNGLLMAATAWILKNTFIGKFFTVDDARARLDPIMENAIAYAKSKVPPGVVTVQIKSDLIRLATEYAINNGMDTLKKLGVKDPKDIGMRVEAEVNKALENSNNMITTPGSNPGEDPK